MLMIFFWCGHYCMCVCMCVCVCFVRRRSYIYVDCRWCVYSIKKRFNRHIKTAIQKLFSHDFIGRICCVLCDYYVVLSRGVSTF